ncbi:MAG: penicillin-binding protein 2 [Candidatus Auribacterota bacterium]|nr:penicillin-binding protein 2 [Candidatus Auribacterota bacterium]
MAIFLLISLIVLLVRLFYLQVQEHEKYFYKANIQQKRNIRIEPRRGFIYDCNRRILAMSIESKSVYADATQIEDLEHVSTEISKILRIDKKDLKKKLSRKKQFVWIKRKLDPEKVRQIQDLDAKGIYLLEEMKREYPHGNLLAQVIGFVDIDNKGLEGLELIHDKILKGEPGWHASKKDGKGREIISRREQEVPAVNGNNIVLTIDGYIQHVCETALKKAVENNDAIGGSVIVLEVNTGKIVAMASNPGYSPAQPAVNPVGNRRNRCITDILEPGSTFKVITGAAALDMGSTDLKDVFFCENGSFPYGGYVLHDVHPYGNLKFKEVIQKSSNIGIAKVALKMGEKNLYRYLKKFGFGEKTDIDLPGEVSGICHPVEKWSKVKVTRIPMGQGVSVTPIQMITAFGSIINGGVLIKPYIVERIKNPERKMIKNLAAKTSKRVISEEASRDIVEAMCAVVSRGGTAPKAYINGYSIGGKTGTAQKVENGKYSSNKFFSSFIGFATARNPEYAILVIIDEPHPHYYGGTVAAPVFKEIMEVVLSYYEVPVDKPGEIS